MPFIEDEKDTNADSHGAAHSDDDHGADHAAHHDHSADHGDGYSLQEGLDHYMDPGHLFGHVQDSHYFEVPKFISSSGKVAIPNVTGYTKENPMIKIQEGFHVVGRPTKFMALELMAAILITVAYIWLARKVTPEGKAPKGRLWNFLESIVCFIRDDIAVPSIGKKDADRYLPFLLTLFLFIIVLNLFGMVPSLGGATGALAVTAVLAIITFAIVMGVGIKKMGFVGFLKAQVPHMELSPVLALILIPSIWMIEVFGLFVKHFVLAIRLFANMFAGHLVLAVFLGFIGVVAASLMLYVVGPIVVVVAVALRLLELFVACLQAYVFTFLAALFIGAALHPH